MNSVERLTDAFYAWEAGGRGWQVSTEPVRLEPVCRPYLRPQFNGPAIDDGRRPTWISGWIDRWTKRSVRSDNERAAEWGAPVSLVAESRETEWREFDIYAPAELRTTAAMAEAWLRGLGNCRFPVSFELWGSRGVSLHLACDSTDAALAIGQAKAFFPGLSCRESSGALEERWQEGGKEWLAVEFGLGREFMVPLNRNWDGPDPLTALLGALASLPAGTFGLVQILFEPVRGAWAENILRSVTTPAGDPFFADAPEISDLAREKIVSPLYAVALRVAAGSSEPEAAWDAIRCISAGLGIFGAPHLNELVPLSAEDADAVADDVRRRITHRSGMIWSAAELAALVHPPDRSVEIAGLRRELIEEPSAPAEILRTGATLGETVHRGEKVPARLPVETRLKHVHVIGSSGTGKSTLMVRLILQDIEAGEGVGVIDPHGDLVDEVLARLPAGRLDDVVLFDPADEDYLVGWNILGANSLAEKEMLSSDLVAVFKRLSTSWGDQMTAVLGNAILAFLESDRGGTLVELRRFLVDEAFREQFLRTVRDPEAVSFWQQEFPLLVGKKPQAPILTRLDTFLRSRLVRAAVTELARPLDFRAMVDRRGIFLGRLSQGAIGQENAALLGALVVSKFHQVSLTRQDQTAANRRPFFLYVDEFQDVATPSMATLFSGVRKYHLGLTVAHQDLYQLHTKVPEVERAVLANAYTRICFRVAEDDARRLEKGLSGLIADDLMNLRTGEALCRVGRKEDVFRIRTSRLAVCEHADQLRARRRQHSLRLHGRLRSIAATPPSIQPLSDPIRTGQVESSLPAVVTPPSVPDSTRRSLERTDRKREFGRGGPEHKYLQELIRQWGQERGFRATVEHVLPNGGRVDVLLEREGLAVACEVAMTTTIEREIGNALKCLAGEFDFVVMTSMRKPFLKQLKEALRTQLSEGELRLKFLAPEELSVFLDEVAAPPSTDRVAGYAVRVRYRRGEKNEIESRKRAIADIMVQSLRHLKGTGS